MKATKIKLRGKGAETLGLMDIDEIYIEGIGYHRREVVYDHLKKYPGSISLSGGAAAMLRPVMSGDGEKCVRSVEDEEGFDALLKLPVEAGQEESFVLISRAY
jgi:hypothetical protein